METKSKTFYACGIDWQEELGESRDLEGRMPLYSSVALLKERRNACWRDCGIVEVRLEVVGWTEPQEVHRK